VRHVWARVGFLSQIAKTALAAGISWWLAELVFARGRPYFAPLAAILTMQVTVAKSVSLGGQRILGVVGGIVVSFLLAHWLGVSALSVGLVVLVSMGLGALAGLGANAVTQSAVTALLVMALGTKASYAAARLMDTVLGAVVAVAVNALLVPPDGTPAALEAVSDLAVQLGRRVSSLGGPPPDVPSLLERLSQTRTLVAAAAESLQYAPLLRSRRRRLRRIRAAERRLTRLAWRLLDVEDAFYGLEQQDRGAVGRLDALCAAMREVLSRYAVRLKAHDRESRLALQRARRELAAQWERVDEHLFGADSPTGSVVSANLMRIVPELQELPD
jgi:uncharacterized membrane protein YgaE (UPF0421/DUF939 family)